jgi:HSP20 family protein
MAQGDRNQPQTGNGNVQAKASKEPARGVESKGREETKPERGGLVRGGGGLSRGATYGGIASPYGFVRRFMDDLDRLSGGMSTGMGIVGAWMPQLEIFREGDDVVIRADVPGVREEDLTIDFEDDVLTIAGERHSERREEEEGFFRSERSYGSFERSIRLPEGIEPEDIQAQLDEGVLELRIKAPAEERRGFKVPIRSQAVEKAPEEKPQPSSKVEATRNKRETH